MKKIFGYFSLIFILFGFVVLAWASYSLTVDTYQFWRYGEEARAKVVALDLTSASGKGGTTYYYELSLDGYSLVEGFRYKLPVGKSITVLTLPHDKEKISLGKSDSSPFELFSYSIGGDFMAILVLGMFVFMIYAGPSTVVQLIKNRHKLVE